MASGLDRNGNEGGRAKEVEVYSHAQIRVIDTGLGIKPDFLPFVFDRFRQADSSITRSYTGLGLGLAIVRHLVELHGGTVRAQSEGESRGATFIVRLPLMPVQAGGDCETGERSGLLSGDLSLAGVQVLLVDNDADTREFLMMALEEWQAKVIAVASATEAMEMLTELRPDVLVSDIGMPGEDGYSLIRKVRVLGAEEGGGIPAVALTAYARPEDRERALLAGFQMHLPKPVEPADLATVVAKLTGRMGRKGS